ncbi:hypothetical protein Tcan_00270 [Toxocara canis]|uniref:Uncharacterized protein n=1 Tax=Toxocara canis TaxID=6265 RepID=A0A0B2VA28_TOXCA|nr:hypothetical protein Tcan_00270 [Toxocara canis]
MGSQIIPFNVVTPSKDGISMAFMQYTSLCIYQTIQPDASTSELSSECRPSDFNRGDVVYTNGLKMHILIAYSYNISCCNCTQLICISNFENCFIFKVFFSRIN